MSDKRDVLAKDYESKKNWLFLVDIVLTFIGLVALIIGGENSISAGIVRVSQSISMNQWFVTALYFTILSVGAFIYFLPLHYYSGYILEHRYQLSTQSIGKWILDQIKSLAVSLIMGLILVEVLYCFLRFTGSLWWIWTACFWLLFSIVLNRIAPTVLIPIFYKLTPMPDTSLVLKLKEMVQKVGCRIVGVFSMELSTKTKKANAAFAGMGKSKRILLGDTLLDNFTDDEIEVVFAHEVGHYIYKHIWKLLSVSVVITFLLLWLVDKVALYIFGKLGLGALSNIAGLPLFLLLLFLFMLVSMPLSNWYSRVLEVQADRFAIKKTNKPEAFISCMTKLANQNLAVKEPNKIIYTIMYSHPSIAKRIEMAEAMRRV